jgi:glycosyltransferase involved in cell wall biosynthesis
VRRADHVIAVSEATKRDIADLYGIAPEKVTVTPHGVDPAFAPGSGESGGFVLFVGAVQARKDPLAAADAAAAVGLPFVVVGPEKEPALAQELRARGADVRGWVEKEELARLYREAAALILPSRFEGFGMPVLEAMASGTPVVLSDDAALAEVAGDAGVYAGDGDFAAALRRALDDRARWSAAGLERAQGFSWEESARRTAEVYRAVVA